MEEHRGSGQGRESAQSSQPEVLRQEDGTGGTEGIAASGRARTMEGAEVERTGQTLADASATRRERGIPRGEDPKREDQSGHLGCDSSAHGQSGEDWWAVEPDVGRVAHGIPARVAQLRALGNAIVPQIAQEIGNAIKGTY